MAIRFREPIQVQFVGRDPSIGDVFPRHRSPLSIVHQKAKEIDPEILSAAGNVTEERSHPDVPAEFLPDLTHEGFFQPFPVFGLAAGKFPVQAEVLVRRPLRDKEAFLPWDQGRRSLWDMRGW